MPALNPSPLLSKLGFGAAPIGNLYSGVDDGDALAAVHAALQHGIRYFDTAPFYGYGLSEDRLGRALAQTPRASFLVSTKVGRLIEHTGNATSDRSDGFAVTGSRALFDYSGDGIRRSLDASLRRLGLDRIDMVLLHDVGALTHGPRHEPMLRQALDEALPAMAELRDAGLVGSIGLGVNEDAVCFEVMMRFPLDCIMLAGRYTLLEQGALALLDEAQRRAVQVIVAGPYNSGLLSDQRAPGSTYNYAPVDASTLARAEHIYALCADVGVDVGAVALQFPLAHPAVVSVVAGQRSVAEVQSAAVRRDTRIPASLWQTLKDEGIVCATAPVPT